jgi:hypothetical protein
MTHAPGSRLVITTEGSMFRGEVATVTDETNPYPETGVYLKIEGWPSMWWSVTEVRPATPEDEARCAPVSAIEGGSAPQDTGPSPNAAQTGAGGLRQPSPEGGVTCA